MCAVGRTVEPRALDPGMDDASVLPSREMRLGSETAREQVAPVPEFDLRQPIMDRGPGLLHDLELDRSPSLFLDQGDYRLNRLIPRTFSSDLLQSGRRQKYRQPPRLVRR